MAVIVSKKFKQNFEIAVKRWLREGDTPEHIEELKALIRIDMDGGEGALRDPDNYMPDPAVRRKLWEDHFQAIADEEAALERKAATLAAGINSRLVNRNFTRTEAT